MELRLLRRFVALATEGSFTRAARLTNIVQSGLSSSISALERELGVLLYVRNTRPVRLTAEGEALVPLARHILDAADAAAQAVREVHGGLSGKLRIGTVQTRGTAYPLSEWLGEFSRNYPGLDVFIHQLPATRQLEMLAAGELDCVIGPTTGSTPPDIETTVITSEPLVLACDRAHPMAGRSVELVTLSQERFIETLPGWASRAQTDSAFAVAGVERRITCEVGEWGMVTDLVGVGLGIAFVPDVLVSGRDTLSTITVNRVSLALTIALMRPKGHASTPAAQRFSEFVQQKLAERQEK